MPRFPKLPPGPFYQRIPSPDGRIVVDIRQVPAPADPRGESVLWRPRISDARTGRTVLDMWEIDINAGPIWPTGGGVVLRLWAGFEITVTRDLTAWSLGNGVKRPIAELQPEIVWLAALQVAANQRKQPAQPKPAEPRKAPWTYDVFGFLLLGAGICWVIWDWWHGKGLPRSYLD